MKTNEITTIADLHNLEMRLIQKIEELVKAKQETNTNSQKEYLKSSEVQKLLANCSEGKLKSLRDKRAIPFTYLYGLSLYPKAELLREIDRNLILVKPKVIQGFGNSEISDLKTSNKLKNGQ